jgi:hypothetical protein
MKMADKNGVNQFFRATELIRTGPSQFGCGPSILDDGSDWLWSWLSLLEVEKPD